jgi:hypothetical protein
MLFFNLNLNQLIIMKNKFLQISIGISLMLLSSGFFIRSIQSAKASEFPDFIQQADINKTLAPNSSLVLGKYTMEYQAFYDAADNKYAQFVLVYNSETGQSKIYGKNGSIFEKSSAQLPQSPLE